MLQYNGFNPAKLMKTTDTVALPRGGFKLKKMTDYSRVRRFISYLLRNRDFQFNRLKLEKDVYLNLGCGPNHKPGFINLDYFWTPEIDVCWDMACPLPLPDASVSGIFTEHCLEHLSYEDGAKALQEIHRLLRPGGVARIVVPDAQLYLQLYEKRKVGAKDLFPYESFGEFPELQTPMMWVNAVFRFHGHLYAYDFETLQHRLKGQGFSKITRCEFQGGSDPKLLVDEPWRQSESLYVEAQK